MSRTSSLSLQPGLLLYSINFLLLLEFNGIDFVWWKEDESKFKSETQVGLMLLLLMLLALWWNFDFLKVHFNFSFITAPIEFPHMGGARPFRRFALLSGKAKLSMMNLSWVRCRSDKLGAWWNCEVTKQPRTIRAQRHRTFFAAWSTTPWRNKLTQLVLDSG